MTAKEEAEEIYDKCLNKIQGLEGIEWWESAKQCALIAIEFAADQFDKYCCEEMGVHWTKDNKYTNVTTDHLRYIKEEVEKL